MQRRPERKALRAAGVVAALGFVAMWVVPDLGHAVALFVAALMIDVALLWRALSDACCAMEQGETLCEVRCLLCKKLMYFVPGDEERLALCHPCSLWTRLERDKVTRGHGDGVTAEVVA